MKTSLLLATLLSLLPFVALAHPSDSWEPLNPPTNYGTDSHERFLQYEIGSLDFVDRYPDPQSLSDQEKYMIAGAIDSFSGRQLSWYQEVYMLLVAYHSQTGTYPAELSDQVIKSVFSDPDSVSADYLELFRCPLTGSYPRINPSSPGPGDFVFRLLTEEEKHFVASRSSYFSDLWNSNSVLDPGTGQWQHVFYSGPYYVRMYGWNGVIMEGIEHMMAGSG